MLFSEEIKYLISFNWVSHSLDEEGNVISGSSYLNYMLPKHKNIIEAGVQRGNIPERAPGTTDIITCIKMEIATVAAAALIADDYLDPKPNDFYSGWD